MAWLTKQTLTRQDDEASGPAVPLIDPQRRRYRWLRRVAYHEAGHAVVAWAVGLKFDVVTIAPERHAIYGPSLGHIGGVPEPERSPLDAGAAENYVTMMLGGIAAMAAIFAGVWGGAESSLEDQLRADRWARRVSKTDEERAAVLAQARSRAREIVLGHRAGLEALAEELWHCKTVDGAEARRILNHCARRNGLDSQPT